MSSYTPSHTTMVREVADALVELRLDDAVRRPEDRSNEETFLIGAVRLYMGEEHAPVGVTMQSVCRSIRLLADIWSRG